MRIDGSTVGHAIKKELSEAMKDILETGLVLLDKYVEADTKDDEQESLKEQEILAEKWHKKAAEAREFTTANEDATVNISSSDADLKGYEIVNFDHDKVQIKMPLLPTVANDFKVNKNRITAGNVKKILLNHIYENDISMPFFDRATLEYTMYIGPDRKKFPPRDVENLNTKDITDCLLGILFENDNLLYIPQITINGKATKGRSFTLLTVRRLRPAGGRKKRP